LKKNIDDLEKMCNVAMQDKAITSSGLRTNYMQLGIDIANAFIDKILTKANTDNMNKKLIPGPGNQGRIQKVIDFFWHTDLYGILYKYMCIASDRICGDTYNDMRTIKLNTFETKTLHFNMPMYLKHRIVYEGYSKTVKYFANTLHIMEITGMKKTDDELLETFDIRAKKMMSR